MQEVGVTQFLRQKWITKPLPQRGSPEGSVVPSKHYEAILILYMVAVAISAVVLLLEALVAVVVQATGIGRHDLGSASSGGNLPFTTLD